MLPLGQLGYQREKPPGLQTTLSLMKIRDRASAKFTKTRKSAHWEYFQEVRNTLKMAIENEKKVFFQSRIRSNGSNRWKLFRELNIYQNKRNSAISNNSHTADQINTFLRDTYQTTSNPD
nr:unnamed protein product [Callosobruchus analis]